MAWERVTKKCKLEMSDKEIYTHFDNHLKGNGKCPNQRCNCVAILANGDIRVSMSEVLMLVQCEIKVCSRFNCF